MIDAEVMLAAAERLDTRKAAAMGGGEGWDTGEITSVEQARMIASGFDLNPKALDAFVNGPVLKIAVEALEAGHAAGTDPMQVALSLWVEGLLFGLMLAEVAP